MSGRPAAKRVLLRCDHIIVLPYFASPPRRNDSTWCPRCNALSQVLGLDLREFVAKCNRCAATSWHGQDKQGAGYAVQRHGTKHADHSPYIAYLAPPNERRRCDNLGEDVAYG